MTAGSAKSSVLRLVLLRAFHNLLAQNLQPHHIQLETNSASIAFDNKCNITRSITFRTAELKTEVGMAIYAAEKV